MKPLIWIAILALTVMSSATPAYAQNYEHKAGTTDAVTASTEKATLKRRVVKAAVKPAPQKTGTQSRSVIFDQRIRASKMNVVRPQTTPVKMPNSYND